MQFIPYPDFRTPCHRARAKLYDMVESLRVCDAKLGMAVDEFDTHPDRKEYFCKFDLIETQCSVRLFLTIFQEIAGGALPTVADRVFRTINAYANLRRNHPHVEGVILAQGLAGRSLDAAMELDGKDNDESDEAWELMTAAHAVIGSMKAMLDGVSACDFDESVLDAILDGRPIPNAGELRKNELAKLLPSGLPTESNAMGKLSACG
jgi:hypothetical protein